MFVLIDDGTLDTVVKCDACGEEIRFNYAEACCLPPIAKPPSYKAFVAECCIDAEEDHLCSHDEHDEQEQDL